MPPTCQRIADDSCNEDYQDGIWKQHFRKVALPLLVNDAPRLAILGRAVTKFGIVIAVTGPSMALMIGGFGF